jgi:MFS family permease
MHMSSDASASQDSGHVYRKVVLRLMPILFLCYILAYLDRVNVGFAKLAMKEELWFSDAVFAFGSGIFFIGYFLFEVPANVIMHRIGARIWLTRIMISWGCLSALCAVSNNAFVFYILRFLLGMAEAGFFPGIILYLTYWFPMKYRARIVALFMTAVAFAGIIGSPLSGWILQRSDDWMEIRSWQWLFILEGIPSILLGLLLPLFLKDSPVQVSWLSDKEKNLIRSDLDENEESKRSSGKRLEKLSDAFSAWKVWLCCLIYLGLTIGLYGVSFWLPQLIELTLTKVKWQIGLYAAIPWLAAAIGMNVFGQHSDRTGERRWHISLAALGSAIGFVVCGVGLTYFPSWAVLVSMVVATTGMMCAVSSFWALPTSMLSGTAAAAGIAWINSVGNLGGFISPELFNWFKTHFSVGIALVSIGFFMSMSGALVWKFWK